MPVAESTVLTVPNETEGDQEQQAENEDVALLSKPEEHQASATDVPKRKWTPGLICLVISVVIFATIVLGFILSKIIIGSAMGSSVQHLRTVVSSPYDDRKYSYVEFDNGLQALLIYDPDAKIGAASLDVRVGSWADPGEFPGLAHFLEHMVSNHDYFSRLVLNLIWGGYGSPLGRARGADYST